MFFIGVHPRSLVHPLDSAWKDYGMRKAVLNPGRMASTP